MDRFPSSSFIGFKIGPIQLSFLKSKNVKGPYDRRSTRDVILPGFIMECNQTWLQVSVVTSFNCVVHWRLALSVSCLTLLVSSALQILCNSFAFHFCGWGQLAPGLFAMSGLLFSSDTCIRAKSTIPPCFASCCLCPRAIGLLRFGLIHLLMGLERAWIGRKKNSSSPDSYL